MPARLLHVFPSFGIGGMQTQFVTVANALGASFHHLIAALDGRHECRAKLAAGTPHEMVEVPPEARGGLKHAWPIARLLRRHAPSLVITYNWAAVEWCLINRVGRIAPGVHCEHGFGVEEATRPHLRRSLFRRLALGRATPLVVPSTTLARVATESWKLGRGQIHHIPNGVDVDDIARRAGSRASPVARAAEGLVVGTVAPLRPEKNLRRLLRAFAAAARERPSWRLAIAGDGPEREPLERGAYELAIRDRVDFLGSLDEPAPALAAFDIFALTSETEQMPYSVLEAMALAKPVVATDVGDIARMVSAENRPFIHAREHEAELAESLSRLGSEMAQRRLIGEANRRRCRDAYDEAKMCDTFARLYEDAIRGHVRVAPS